MYKARIGFSDGVNTYRPGDTVPTKLRYNNQRLKSGIIYEVKVTEPTETKNVSKRKSKDSTK